MNYIAESISLLNSSYSKDKIVQTLKKIMPELGIKDFMVLSNMVQVCSTSPSDSLLTSQIKLKCGNYDVLFKYNKLEHKSIPSIKDIECILAAFIVAIENSIIYKDITDSIIFSKNKEYLTYDNLIADISTEIKNYERFGTNFCVAKIVLENISLGGKFNFKVSKYIDTIRESIRATDNVYRDSKNIYILFRNVDLENGIKLIEKIKNIVYTNEIGIAEWKSTYVIVDLMSEIDNYIYLSQEKYEKDKKSLVDELNLILNKALYKNDDISIVIKKDIKDIHLNKVSLFFNLNNIEYAVLKNVKNTTDFSFVYNFSGDEIAEDIISELSKNKQT